MVLGSSEQVMERIIRGALSICDHKMTSYFPGIMMAGG
jgi:hypothetical protein